MVVTVARKWAGGAGVSSSPEGFEALVPPERGVDDHLSRQDRRSRVHQNGVRGGNMPRVAKSGVTVAGDET